MFIDIMYFKVDSSGFVHTFNCISELEIGIIIVISDTRKKLTRSVGKGVRGGAKRGAGGRHFVS